MINLLGIWLFTSMIYQGNVLPAPNPDLRLYFNFISETENELLYFRKGEPGYCRRLASYTVTGNQFTQHVFFVDPGNADFCASDQDMQHGTNSTVPFQISNENLQLTLPLGDEDIVFIFAKHAAVDN